jgi:hypothetical protein
MIERFLIITLRGRQQAPLHYLVRLARSLGIEIVKIIEEPRLVSRVITGFVIERIFLVVHGLKFIHQKIAEL